MSKHLHMGVENRWAQERRGHMRWRTRGLEWGWRDWEDQEFLTLFDLSWSLLFTKLHQHSLLGCGNTLRLALLKVMAARKGLPRWWSGCS